MKSRRIRAAGLRWALVPLGLAAAGMLWAAGPPVCDKEWTARFLQSYLAAWIVYVVAAVVASRAGRAPRWVLLWIVLVAIGMRLVCLARTPPLSTDVWRYLWDGRVINAGINPYRYPPQAARAPRAPEDRKPPADVRTLRALRDENWRPINYKRVPTIYPPLAQMLFAGLARVRDRDAEAFRWAFTIFDVASILVLIALLRRTGRPGERVIWYAWCPLSATEVTAGAHVDAFGLFLLLFALLLAARSRARPGPVGGIALAGAVMAKGYALLALPFFLKRGGWRFLAAFALAMLMLVAPFVGARERMFEGLDTYLGGWETNASIFVLLDRMLQRSVAEHFDLTRNITLAAVVLVVVALTWRQKPGMKWLLGATFGAIGAQLLLGAPTLPWYAIWVVPALCWWAIPGIALFSLTVSAQYYARWLYPADEVARETLLWVGYAPVYALLVGQLIYLVIARLRRRVRTRRSASSRSP